MLYIVALLLLWYFVDRFIRRLKISNLSNKHIFITGCDSGFGRDLAVRLDTMGVPVFAGCLTDAGLDSLNKICSSRLRTVRCDVTDEASIRETETFVRDKLPEDGVLWAVVNNAGVTGLAAPLEMCSRQDIIDCCQVNLFGPADVTRVFLPLLRKSRGRIVNMISVMGRTAAASGPYCMSKFGMEAFTDVLRREVTPHGVTVCAIEPGYHKTPLLALNKVLHDVKEAFGRCAPDVQAAYGGPAFFDRFTALISAQFDRSSASVHDVVDAYVEALTSRFPRQRYLVGWDALLIFAPLSFLPGWIGDWLAEKAQQQLLKESGYAS